MKISLSNNIRNTDSLISPKITEFQNFYIIDIFKGKSLCRTDINRQKIRKNPSNPSNPCILTKKNHLVLLLLLLIAGNIHAFDPQYSQYYASPLLTAPSFAGNSLGTRAFLTYRDQWAMVTGSYVTYAVGIDNNFYALNSGVGLVAIHDVAGAAGLGTTSASLLYSYRFNVTDDWRIRPGISFTYAQRSLSKRALWGDQITNTGDDGVTVEPPFAPYYYFDASSSIVAYNSNMWFGLCVDHLLQPNMSSARLNSKAMMMWKQFGGINFTTPSRVGKPPEILSLNYLLKVSKQYKQFDVGINWYRAPLLMGFAWRGLPPNGYDCLILTVGLGFNNIAFGYSYDFTVSKLGTPTGGSHEITLSISFNEGGKSQKRGEIPCPDVVKFRMFGDKESFR